MKKHIKDTIGSILQKITASNVLWSLYKPLAEVNADIYVKKKQEARDKAQLQFLEDYKYLISDSVMDGPFKGLKYPFLSSLHSTLFPKLLGCYEFELHDALNQVFQKKYHSILDIGCAEGYYAVGLAKKFPDSIVYAIDINPEALEKTNFMATSNKVALVDKFKVLNEVTPDFLLSLDPSERHLIFSDCEGYESSLFTEEVIKHLSNSDFIVEMHDFVSPGISDLLQKRFKITHNVQLIKSIDDIFRYREIDNSEILSLPISDRINILAEKRPTQMEWVFCQPKNFN